MKENQWQSIKRDQKEYGKDLFCREYKRFWKSKTDLQCFIYECPFDGWNENHFFDMLRYVEMCVDEDIRDTNEALA